MQSVKNRSGCGCCSTPYQCGDIPSTLYLTDDNGTHELHLDTSFHGTTFGSWYGCYTISGIQVWNGVGGSCTTVSGTMAVGYTLSCSTPLSTGVLNLQQNFGSQACSGGSPIMYRSSACTGDKAVVLGNILVNATPANVAAVGPLSIAYTVPTTVTVSGTTVACPVSGAVTITE